MLDSLRGLMANVLTLHKIARFYGTPARLGTLLSKVTNQMIRCCKDHILAPGKVWDQDRPTLIANMRVRGAWTIGLPNQLFCVLCLDKQDMT